MTAAQVTQGAPTAPQEPPDCPTAATSPTRSPALAAALALERALGDPLDDKRPGSFRASVLADREQRFPEELCAAALDWGIAEYLVPVDSGGRLRSVEECFALSRVLSRRDLTATVALGASVLASVPVWLHGTPEQRNAVAQLIRGGAYLSFALSERDHGADVAAGEVTARKSAEGWRIDGTKWLINNSGHASAATVAARTGEGFRGLTLFLLPRDRPAAADAAASPSQTRPWSALPKVRTHGLRGSAFGGITLSDYPAGESDVVGRVGHGLEMLLTTLQVTRVLVASFALGALDTCLRATVDFTRTRTLYGAPIADLEPVARKLADAYADLLIGETVAHAACRAAHLAPGQLPLMSACVKFLVPQTATDGIDELSVVLGARSYVAGEHWHGICEKMRRDCAVTPLFDGSSPVMLGAIADQLPALAQAREEGAVEEIPPGVFAPSSPTLPWIDEAELDLAADSDAVLHGITAAYELLDGEGDTTAVPYRRQLLDLLEWCRAETASVDAEVARWADDPEWRRSGAAYDLAVRYSHLHAAGACAWKWLAWRADSPDTPDTFVTGGAWLVLCLRRLARRAETAAPGTPGIPGADRMDGMDGTGGPGGPPWSGAASLDEVDRAALARLDRAYDERRLFSDFVIPLG